MIEKLRDKVKERIHHTHPWDRHVTILKEVGTGYHVIRWRYNDQGVYVRSKDGDFVSTIRDCIEMYYEEFDKRDTK